MPRLLPRLLQKVAYQSLETNENHVGFKFANRPRSKKASRKALPPAPSFLVVNRVQSVLLDPINPIIDSKKYVQHKISKEYGQMTLQEREWNRVLMAVRMLSSPLRKCFLTQRYLPSDFLIRLAPMRLPSPRVGIEAQYLLPDGLEHPKFKNRKSGMGHYIICWKAAIEQLSERGSYRRFSPSLNMHSMLSQQIGHILRVRVLQELEILGDYMRVSLQNGKDAQVLRRLTRAEFKAIKAAGVIPYDSGVAVLVVPPPNRSPVTKQRPEPYSGSLFLENQAPTKLLNSSRYLSPPPLSTLYPACDISPDYTDDLPDALPHPQIPIYNGVTLFPSPTQRAALYAHLNRILLIERRARHYEREEPSHIELDEKAGKNTDKRARGDQKASHAFLLCSDAMTMRGDVAMLAIALWRVRMWEGGGWEEGAVDNWASN